LLIDAYVNFSWVTVYKSIYHLSKLYGHTRNFKITILFVSPVGITGKCKGLSIKDVRS